MTLVHVDGTPVLHDEYTTGNVKLFDFQTTVHKQVIAELESGSKTVMLQMPTGAGKTELAAAEVERRRANGWRDVIFLVHRDTLVSQTLGRFRKYGIPCVAGSGPGSKWKPRKPRPTGVIVMGVQTYINRLKADPDAGMGAFLICDEAHWYPDDSRWGNVVKAHHGQALGMTATPWRMGITEKFEPTWQALVEGPQTDQLVEMGRLAESVLYDVPSWVGEDGKRHYVRGERETRESERKRSQDGYNHYATWEREKSKGTLTKDAVSIWYARTKGQHQTIVFALTVDHAYALAEIFNALSGMPGLEDFGTDKPVAQVIVGETPTGVRDVILEDFSRKDCRVLINVDVLREGFDAPEASCLLVLRHTDSVAFWRQMAGRVLRAKSDGSAAMILDLVQNHKRLGFPDQRRKWSLKPQVDGMVQGEAPVKTCCEVAAPGMEGCDAINYLPSHKCVACGMEFGKVCPPEPNGCGQWRPWSRWSGAYHRIRPGACDLCGDAKWRLEAHLTRKKEQEERQERWALEAKMRKDRDALDHIRQTRFNNLVWMKQQILEVEDQLKYRYRAPKPQWPWRRTENHNGHRVDFALCRAWVGWTGGHYGKKIQFAVFANNNTPENVADNIRKLNRTNPGTGPAGKGFANFDAAKLAIEELFERFRESNKLMLQGVLCGQCLEVYVPFVADNPSPRCQSCAIRENTATVFADEDDDLPF